MSLNLQNTINFSKTFIQYVPLTAGLGMEPAVSIASMIRNSILNAPQTWAFNRNQQTFPIVKSQQDYDVAITANDFSFLEKLSLTDDQGNIVEIKDVYNSAALAVSAFEQRPNAVAAQSTSFVAGAQHVSFRFLGVPDQGYTVTAIYQKLSPQFGPFFISSVANHVSANTTYTGIFSPNSFPAGSTATIVGFANGLNNGTFVVVSCTTTSLVLINGAGVAETKTAYAINLSWDPIPDQYSDIYNNLFLAEALASVDDSRAQLYRQRGVAAFMAKSSGLTEMQKNIFAQQWIQRTVERASVAANIQTGNNGRGL